jgi:hypothetical protein
MSHFVRIRTQIREREHLVQALRDLHHRFQEGENHVVKGWQGNRETVEVPSVSHSRFRPPDLVEFQMSRFR